MTLHFSSSPARGAARGLAARVLVVERDDEVREVLGLAFTGMGLETDCASGFAAARALLTQRAYRLIVTDLELADGDGLMLVRHARAHCPGLPVVVLTAKSSLESVVEALKAGAVECLAKPVSLDELRAMVRNTLDIVLPSAPSEPVIPPDVLLGETAEISRARETIAVAAKLRVAVAIDGEPGCGKRLAARLIHATSARADRPFVIIDCAAALTPVEIFGAEKGGNAESERDVDGLLHAADGGTVVLHHVDTLPARLQLRLARVLEERRLRRAGAVFDEAIDLRVIATSVLPLARAHAEGRMVDALYFALDRFEVHMPSVRDGRDDIPLLAGHILARLGGELGVPQARFSQDAIARLVEYPFPGNVREMECVVERALARNLVEEICAQDLRLPALPDEGG